ICTVADAGACTSSIPMAICLRWSLDASETARCPSPERQRWVTLTSLTLRARTGLPFRPLARGNQRSFPCAGWDLLLGLVLLTVLGEERFQFLDELWPRESGDVVGPIDHHDLEVGHPFFELVHTFPERVNLTDQGQGRDLVGLHRIVGYGET